MKKLVAVVAAVLLTGCGHAPVTGTAPVAKAAKPVAAAAKVVAKPAAQAQGVSSLVAVAPAELDAAGDFARFVEAAKAARPSTFHLSGSVKREQLLTAEIDGTIGGEVVVTASNVAGLVGKSLDAEKVAPFLAAVPPSNPKGLLAELAASVKHEELVQRDGQTVAMFSFADGPAAAYQVGFPVQGGLKTYVEGADELRLVLSAR